MTSGHMDGSILIFWRGTMVCKRTAIVHQSTLPRTYRRD